MRIPQILALSLVLSLLFVGCDPAEETITDTQDDGVSDATEVQQTDTVADTATDTVTLGPDECLVQSDCTNSGLCTPADADQTCGMCQELPACLDDMACSTENPDNVCDARPMCLCSPGPVCVAKCTVDTECSRDEVCAADGHCEPRSCVESPCPSTFLCDGESSTCVRKTCSSGADCAATDFCVAGQCADQVGTCELPKP